MMKKFLLTLMILFAAVSLHADPEFYKGTKGKDIVLAIPEAKGVNLSEDRQYFTVLLQTQLTDTFQRFSPIQIVDRQNEDITDTEIARSEDGSYSDYDYAEFGKKINAKYVAVAQLIDNQDFFSLSVRFIETETNSVKLTYSQNKVSARAIKNGSAINMAVKNLLTQMGIELTDEGLTAINGGVDEKTLLAQENLSKGITASKRGTTVEALQYYYAAAEYNINSSEINARLNKIQTAISSGNIGDKARGEDEAYAYWKKTLNEADDFFTTHPPYEIVYSKNIRPLERTEADLENQENTFQLAIGLVASENSRKTIRAIKKAIKSSPAIVENACKIWPEKSLVTKEENYWFYPYDCFVTVQIINDTDKVIAQERIALDLIGPALLENGSETVTYAKLQKQKFKGIKSKDISDNLTIRIESVEWDEEKIETEDIRITCIEDALEVRQEARKTEKKTEVLSEDALTREEARKEAERKIQERREADRKAAENENSVSRKTEKREETKTQEESKTKSEKKKSSKKSDKKAEKKTKKNAQKKEGFFDARATQNVHIGINYATDFAAGDSTYGVNLGYNCPLFGNVFCSLDAEICNDYFEISNHEISSYFSCLLGAGCLFRLNSDSNLFLKGCVGSTLGENADELELFYRAAAGIDYGNLEIEYSLDYLSNGLVLDRLSIGAVFQL